MRGGGAYTSGTRVGCIMGCGPADEGSMEAMADAAERARSVGEARGCARGACVVVAVGRERDRVGAGVWVHPRERRCWRSAAGERRGAMVLWRLSAVCAGDGDARWWCDRRSHRPGRM